MKAVAIVGLGPRGTAVLERLVENARLTNGEQTVVHVYDDQFPGAGAVWHPRQSPQLLMNTVTSQVTLFTDETVECSGPIVPGPSMYEWIADGHASRYVDTENALRSELTHLGADDYPSRALYGMYLSWVFERTVDRAPDHMRIEIHKSRVVSLDRCDGYWLLADDSHAEVAAEEVVLALGHLPSKPDAKGQEIAKFAAAQGLTYIPPANPADIDLSAVPGQAPVIIRGLGLCFFDYLGLLTTGRGGQFHNRNGSLEYIPSGREPYIHAGCRRGIPHHARGTNQKGVSERHIPRFLTTPKIDQLARAAQVSGPLDFMGDVWPLISAEVEFAYTSALLVNAGAPLDEAGEAQLVEALLAAPQEKASIFKGLGVPEDQVWDWTSILHPCRNAPTRNHRRFTEWLAQYLGNDISHARGGNVQNPVKTGVDALRDLRNEVRQVIDHGTLAAHSYRDHVTAWYTPMNAYLSIGPPVHRVEELLALIKAGVVSIAGPDFTVDPDLSGAFSAYSPLIPDSRQSAEVLIEARLPDNHANTTADALVEQLLSSGTVRQHVLTRGHIQHRTGSIDITTRPYRVVSEEGNAQAGLYAFGVTTEGVHWATAAGVRPGVGSVILTDADAIARSALGLDEDAATVSNASDELGKSHGSDGFEASCGTSCVGV